MVPKLDLNRPVDISAGSVDKPTKKKSLFATQFQSKGLAFFGINAPPTTVGSIPRPSTTSRLVSKKDRVEPIFVCQLTGRESLDRRPEDRSIAGGSGSGLVLKDRYSSTAAETWDRQVTSSTRGWE